MAKIQITAAQLQSIGTMEAGWALGKLSAFTKEPSKDRNSMNYKFTWQVVDGGIVREIPELVNDKNSKYFVEGLINIYEALFDVMVDKNVDIELDPEQWVNLECYLNVGKKIYQDRPSNEIIGHGPKSRPPF